MIATAGFLAASQGEILLALLQSILAAGGHLLSLIRQHRISTVSYTHLSVKVTDSVKGGQMTLFPTEMEQLALDIIDTYGVDTVVDIPRLRKENPRLDLAARIAEPNHFMHWELDFADVYKRQGSSH